MHNDGLYYKIAVPNGDSSHSGCGKNATCVTLIMATKQLGNLLNPTNDGDLGAIVRRARKMGELTEVLARSLPPEQAEGIVAANLREDGELVVIATTSAWASRLRYETDTLLEAARSVGIEVHACRIRVSQS
jgi:hypothetical protein